MQDGLPQNSVNDMVQSEDGYLWLATFGGLARFDGVHFETFDQTWGLPSPRVLALALAADDSIWMGFEDAGIALRAPSKGMQDRYTHDLAGAKVFDLHRAADELWMATSEGVFALEADGELRKVMEARAHGLGSDGAAGVYVYNEFATTHLPPRPGVSLDEAYQVLVEEDARHWRLGPNDLALWDGQRAYPVAQYKDRHWLHAGPIRGPGGALWFSVGPRLYRLGARAQVLQSPSEPLKPGAIEVMRFDRPIRSLFADRENNIWVGTDGDGLHRLTPQPFSEVTSYYDLAPQPCRGLLGDGEGGYYVARDCQVAHLGSDGTLDIVYEDIDCPGALALDHEGGLWFGARRLFHRTQEGLRQVTGEGELGSITALLTTRAGVTFVGSNSGLWRVRHDQTPELIFGSKRSVSSLVEDDLGNLWAGLYGRVLKIQGTKVEVLTEADGVPSGQVRAIIPISADEVWFGSYGGGIARLSPDRVTHLTRKNGLIDNFISALIFDSQGSLWANSNQGVFVIEQPELRAIAQGHSSTLSAHPLPTGEGMGASPGVAAHLERGTLAFATVEGVVEVRVDELEANPVRPNTILESVRINGAEITRAKTAVIPPGRARLDVFFTAAALRSPNLVSFEYQLLGVDADWTEAGARRSAHYDNLGPGEYCIVVRAINENNVPGRPAQVCFSVEPHLYERSTAQAGFGILLLLLGWASHRWRTREIKARNLALNAEVSQRELAEVALGEREAHYRRVFESLVNGFILTDQEGVITGVNPAVCDMLKQPESALLGCDLDDVLGRHGEGPPPTAHNPQRALDEVMLCSRSDGTKFEARVTSHPFPGMGGARMRLTTMVDVSPLLKSQAEQHRLREELLHSQRVEAIGVLAGGVAHDVNNMLTAVQGYAELAHDLLEEGGDVDEASELIAEVLVSAKRTSKVTRQLLTYGRRQATHTRVLNLSHSIRDIHALLVRGLSPLVRVEFDLTDNPACVEADPTQLEQLVVNLVINAIAAMPDGGTVRVSTALLPAEAIQQEYTTIDAEAAFVRLRVEDEGIGMTDEVRGRIFDPFFTTKGVGKGTGLGLSGVYGIVTQAKGHIDVQSQPGAGSRFDVLLPALEDRDEDPATVDLEEAAVGGDEALIAYVDDDPHVRKATCRVLKRAGFRIVDFEDPTEALEALRTPKEMPQVLITDMVMPGMSGAELATKLMELHPKLPVLYISGYTAGSLSDLDPKRERFLSKPFSHRVLIRTVQELLDTQAMTKLR